MVTVPAGTQLIVVDDTPGDIEPSAYFGYDPGPADDNNDGRPDVLPAAAILIGHATAILPYWDNDNDADILFFNLGASFHGVASDFWVAIDDPNNPLGNFDLNSIQVVPEPSIGVMLLAEIVLFACCRNVRRPPRSAHQKKKGS